MKSKAPITPNRVLLHLQQHHVGADNGVCMRRLAVELVGDNADARDERQIRYAIVDLRENGHPVCAHPGAGYFYAENEVEVNQTCEFLLSRANHSLKQIAALKRKAVPDLRGQLSMDV